MFKLKAYGRLEGLISCERKGFVCPEYSLNHQIKGKGDKTIIFVHGNSQSLSYWDIIINDKTLQDYALIAFDLPGHGKSFRSKNPNKDYSLKGLAAHAADFIKQFEKKPYLLVANSLGTNIIGEMVSHLQNCKGIMLAGSSAAGMDMGPDKVIMPNPNVGYILVKHLRKSS